MTIDAIVCQRNIAKQIVDQEADYVLGLKGNQDTLHEAVDDFFSVADTNHFRLVNHEYFEETEKGHDV